LNIIEKKREESEIIFLINTISSEYCKYQKSVFCFQPRFSYSVSLSLSASRFPHVYDCFAYIPFYDIYKNTKYRHDDTEIKLKTYSFKIERKKQQQRNASYSILLFTYSVLKKNLNKSLKYFVVLAFGWLLSLEMHSARQLPRSSIRKEEQTQKENLFFSFHLLFR